LRTRAIPERLSGVFTTRRYTNPRLSYLTVVHGHGCVTVDAEKEISQEKIARQLAIGRKYSVRLDKSVSGDLQKLRDRLAVAKAELTAIRADVVTVTSPVRRSPPDPPRAAAGPPKSKQMQADTTRPVVRPPVYSLRNAQTTADTTRPVVRPPVYSLRNAQTTGQPVVKSGQGTGVPARGPIAVARKPGAGTKQQVMKVIYMVRLTTSSFRIVQNYAAYIWILFVAVRSFFQLNFTNVFSFLMPITVYRPYEWRCSHFRTGFSRTQSYLCMEQIPRFRQFH